MSPPVARILSTTEHEPVDRRAAYDACVDGKQVRFHQADMVLNGTEETEGRPEAVTIAIVQSCPCGRCDRARGLEFVMMPQYARTLAAQLLQSAEAVEAAAKAAADAVLRKVVGK